MSKFLAPIHFWLYKKIEIQEDLIQKILEKSEIDKKSFYQEYGSLPEGDMEDHIDTSNIHGWLQDTIIDSEKRLAAAIKKAIEAGVTEKELKDLYYEEGKSLGKSNTPQEAYQKVNDSLLDGMPCDRVNNLISQTEEEVIWQRTVDLHGDYFAEENLDKELYYELRDGFLKGLAEENLSFERNGQDYYLRSK